jgi:hypothetical protein
MPFHPVRVAKKPLKITGCEKCGLGVELDELIEDTIMGMREVADEIGLGLLEEVLSLVRSCGAVAHN